MSQTVWMDEHTRAAQEQWNRTPCGVREYLAALEYGSREFFDEIRRQRYEVSDTWMTEKIDFSMARDKRLLEIGFGLGSDLLTFAEAGAEVHGIDITEEHYRLASRNFAVHNRAADLKLCTCAEIDYPSEYFDVVYSNGVLHHTPYTVRCISEVYRVLKPGGRFVFSMYYRYSAFHLITVLLYRGILRGRLFRLGYRGLLSTVENGADGVTIKPLVKTYSKGQLAQMLADFSQVEFTVAHFRRDHLPKIGPLIPQWLEKPLEPYVGWYLLTTAVK